MPERLTWGQLAIVCAITMASGFLSSRYGRTVSEWISNTPKEVGEIQTKEQPCD